jgi:hypothetical protein
LVPLCILFLCTGWAASIIIVYLAFTQLSAIRKMHVDESVYVRHLVDSYSKEAVQQGEGGGTPVVRRVSFTLAKQLEVCACAPPAINGGSLRGATWAERWSGGW